MVGIPSTEDTFARRVNLVRNGENCKMQNIELCEGIYDSLRNKSSLGLEYIEFRNRLNKFEIFV